MLNCISIVLFVVWLCWLLMCLKVLMLSSRKMLLVFSGWLLVVSVFCVWCRLVVRLCLMWLFRKWWLCSLVSGFVMLFIFSSVDFFFSCWCIVFSFVVCRCILCLSLC